MDRHSEIIDDMVGDILRGRYKPADRLPRWRDLTSRYNTTLATVQKALHRLNEYGFIESGGWHGNRVVEHPPHLNHFGLVLPESDGAGGSYSSHFWATLAHVAGGLRDTRPRWMSVYGNVRGEQEQDLQRLRTDLNARRLAGLILTEQYTAQNPRFASLLQTASVPVVALLSGVNLPGVTPVLLRPEDFMERACAYLQKQGRRRVAFVSVAQAGPTMWGAAQAALAAHGLETRPWWRVEASEQYPAAVQSLMQMMMRLPAGDRPDALVITDDHLVPDATAGLVAAGVCVPRDLAVVAHANFPLPTASALPVVRLGFDVRRVVAICLDVLDQRRVGAAVPEPVIVPAEFETEISRTD